MAFDERLADRIRGSLGRRKGLVEKKMFGGVAFLLNGNMCVGVHKSDLIVRLAPEATDAALARAHTRRFDLTGRPMKGWILVEQSAFARRVAEYVRDHYAHYDQLQSIQVGFASVKGVGITVSSTRIPYRFTPSELGPPRQPKNAIVPKAAS